MLLKSSFVKWVPLLIFENNVSVHFLQTHLSLDSIILKCSEMSIDQILMKPLWSSLIWPEVSQKSPTHIFRALLFPALLCCSLCLFPMLVDEVDGVLGGGPEDFKTLMNQASSPLTMSMKPFYACHIATYCCCNGIMMRWYPRWWLPPYFLVDTCIVHNPTFLWGLWRWD